SGDFSACGGDVYARGHLRAYARQVDLNPDSLIERFKATAPATPVDPGPSPTRPLSARAARPLASLPGPLDPGSRRFVPIAVGLGVLLVVALTFQGISSWRSDGDSRDGLGAPGSSTTPSSAPSATPSPSTPARSPEPSASARPPKQTTPAEPTIPAGSSALRVRATRGSWVSVRTAAGKTLFSGLLPSGQTKDFVTPGSLQVTLGNAGGVELTVNGKNVGPAGNLGEVVRLQVRPGAQLRL
ncbi:MAG: RodZ domain-containing protein, partial [Angustibacter sp.]